VTFKTNVSGFDARARWSFSAGRAHSLFPFSRAPTAAMVPAVPVQVRSPPRQKFFTAELPIFFPPIKPRQASPWLRQLGGAGWASWGARKFYSLLPYRCMEVLDPFPPPVSDPDCVHGVVGFGAGGTVRSGAGSLGVQTLFHLFCELACFLLGKSRALLPPGVLLWIMLWNCGP